MTRQTPEADALAPVRLRSGDTELAVVHRAATSRGAAHVLFCGGFHSSMRGDKARAIEAFCVERGHACTRFDYRGHGESGGDPERLTLADWLDDALRVVDHVTRGSRPLIVVGSSMGAWLAVHVALRRPGRVAALALVAAAPDFLHERVPEALDARARARLDEGLVARLATPENPSGYPVTRELIDSGRALALLTTDAARALDCPVRLLHGTADDVAPWQLAAALLEGVGSDDATLELVRGGDHRLSSPRDLVRLARILEELCSADPPISR